MYTVDTTSQSGGLGEALKAGGVGVVEVGGVEGMGVAEVLGDSSLGVGVAGVGP